MPKGLNPSNIFQITDIVRVLKTFIQPKYTFMAYLKPTMLLGKWTNGRKNKRQKDRSREKIESGKMENSLSANIFIYYFNSIRF